MRMLERVLNNGVIMEGLFFPSLDNATVLIADSIVESYLQFGADDTSSEFGCIRPPWDKAFVEAKLTFGDVAVDTGIMLFTDKVESEQRTFLVDHYNKQCKARDGLGKLANAIKSCDSLITAGVWINISGVAVCSPFVGYIPINSHGESLACHVMTTLNQDDQKMTEASRKPLRVALYAMAVVNCKNMETAIVESPENDITPKTRRRLRLPEIRRYTLRIKESHKRSASETVYGASSRPLHSCRGHFATYTEERPLFGKYTGKFWIPQHMKGSKERGEIIKDYILDKGC